MKMKLSKYSKCINCNKCLPKRKVVDLTEQSTFFSRTCNKCISTCSSCGGDLGIVRKIDVIATGHCDICDHQCCRSCVVNVSCDNCDVTACTNCIENKDDGNICDGLKRKLRIVQKFP